MDKKHLIAAFVALVTVLMAFVIGCSLVQVPTAQQTPIVTTVLSFLAILGTQIWAKADSDRQIQAVKRDVQDIKANTGADGGEPPGG
jgi:uncharacterized membrane protein